MHSRLVVGEFQCAKLPSSSVTSSNGRHGRGHRSSRKSHGKSPSLVTVRAGTSASAIHRCSTAYARHGRQRSARASSSDAVEPSPVCGKLSLHADVGGEKRVALAERAHRDVLRRPFADAGQICASCATASARSRRGSNRRAVGTRRRGDARERPPRALSAFPGRPMPPALNCSGRGKACVSPGMSTLSRRPACRARRRCGRRVAWPPSRVICWPSTARTAISNPSQRPARAGPGRAATSGARIGSDDSAAAIAAGSALRSNIRRMRAMIVGSAFSRGKPHDHAQCRLLRAHAPR